MKTFIKTKKNDNYFCELFEKKNIDEIKNENENINNKIYIYL